MIVDLLPSKTWEDWNESLRPVFGLRADEQGRMFRGMSAAVCEMVLGTAIFFSHKKQLAWIEGDTWAFESVIPHLYKLGFQVQVIPRSQVPGVGAGEPEWQKWMDTLAHDTNFVLWSEDNPVTGDFFDGHVMDKVLGAKRILSIAVSHSSFRLRTRDLLPYSVQLQSLSSEYTWVRMGARMRTPPLFTHRQGWGPVDRKAVDPLLARVFVEDRAAVEKAEAAMTTSYGFHKFSFNAERLYDRAVVWHPTRNGAAIAEILKRDLGLPLEGDAVSGCDIHVLPSLDHWWKPLPSDDILRGLVVLGVEAIRHPRFYDHLQSALQDSIFTL